MVLSTKKCQTADMINLYDDGIVWFSEGFSRIFSFYQENFENSFVLHSLPCKTRHFYSISTNFLQFPVWLLGEKGSDYMQNQVNK